MPKQTSCIKTGAHVYFPQYAALISADVFRVGNTIVVITWPDQLPGDGSATRYQHSVVDLVVTYPPNDVCVWRPDRGMFVVPESEVLFNKPM